MILLVLLLILLLILLLLLLLLLLLFFFCFLNQRFEALKISIVRSDRKARIDSSRRVLQLVADIIARGRVEIVVGGLCLCKTRRRQKNDEQEKTTRHRAAAGPPASRRATAIEPQRPCYRFVHFHPSLSSSIPTVTLSCPVWLYLLIDLRHRADSVDEFLKRLNRRVNRQAILHQLVRVGVLPLPNQFFCPRL